MLTPHASIHDLADHLDIPFAQLFDILASPAVKAHLDHIRKTLDTRLRIRLADAAHAAVDTLDEIVRSPAPHGNPALRPTGADPTLEWQTERRRAATTILRAHALPRNRRRARRPNDIAGLTTLIDKLEGLTDTLHTEPPTRLARSSTEPHDVPPTSLQVGAPRPARPTDDSAFCNSSQRTATRSGGPTPLLSRAGKASGADRPPIHNIRPP
jgi:hypothetical protein